ncbi:MAG: family 78 glycoside hydrolase catalytic domain [Pirellulales bacterium]|nr:family 78 glycoside hydrolase catalytic domain [Pirellulales bacterium]
MRICLLTLIVFCLTVPLHAAESPATAEYLRCEFRVEPLGTDVVNPRLSWEMHDSRRGAKQTAYQILVASTPEKLTAGEGNLWDTGRVESSDTVHIVYAGKPLASRTRCHWKVRLWDADGKPSEFSRPALWTMGLLEPQDVKAKWIGTDGVPAHPSVEPLPPLFDGSIWIWLDKEGLDLRVAAEPGRRFFRKTFTMPKDRKITRARISITADDKYELFVNGESVGSGDDWQKPKMFDLTKLLKPGVNCLAVAAENVNIPAAGVAAKLEIEFDQGEPLNLKTDNTWKASRTAAPGWKTIGFDDSRWPVAMRVTGMGGRPWFCVAVDGRLQVLPASMLRKEFDVKGQIKRATVYASALGNYRLYVNGKPVGNDYFTPGWSDYKKRIYCNTYDVTELVRADGPNAIGGVLAAGWYAGVVGGGQNHFHYGKEPRLLAQLEIELADGTIQTVATDETWRLTYGPWIEAEMQGGETYDATKEIPGWTEPGLDDSTWQPARVTESIPAKLQSFPSVTTQETGEIRPVEITEPKPGVYVVNMGQEFAGVARLKVKGPRGTKVTLRFAERLNPDGTVYRTNLRGARCTDAYVLKGEGEEVWQPHFTFRGYQYVEITGFPGKPTLDTLTGIALNSATPLVGRFECSNPMINRLYQNIVWTQRANFISVPTDCPQRDERLGWMGDIQTFVSTAAYNADVESFMTKWMVDVRDAQKPDGEFSNVSPRIAHMAGGVAGWGDAGVICPLMVYYYYNDRRMLEQSYDSMVRWVEYCRKNSTDLIRPDAGFGDWVAMVYTPKDVIATAYFARSASLTCRAAMVLGKKDDVDKYCTLFNEIKAAFNREFVSEDGKIKGDTQTCYVLALAFDLLPEDKQTIAVERLVADIKARDNHLSTGFLGTSELLSVLSEYGHNDLAYKLLLNDTFPSWGFTIKHGATTIWERWDGWTPEHGFQSPGMNSFAHYPFGSVGRWLFKNVAGIDTTSPGYYIMHIGPKPGPGLTWAKADYRSIHGLVKSAWKIENDILKMDVTIPANTEVCLAFPVSSLDQVTENGKPVAEPDLIMTPDTPDIFVGSGTYHFEMPWKPKTGDKD